MLLQHNISKDTTECTAVSNKDSYYNHIKLGNKNKVFEHNALQVSAITIAQRGENKRRRVVFTARSCCAPYKPLPWCLIFL